MRGNSLFAGLVLVLLAGCASAGETCQVPGNVVRVDDRNERLFVVASDSDVANMPTVKKMVREADAYVAACKGAWSAKWSVSVFSDKKYAAYKDEDQVAPYLQSGEWATAYLAEYDNSNGQLTRFPLQQRRNEVQLEKAGASVKK